MIKWIFQQIYTQPLSKIIFMMFLLILVWGKIDHWCSTDKKRKKSWQIANGIAWLTMIFAITMITISSRTEGVLQVHWTPFHSFREAKIQPELYRSMLMNVFLFFPLGLTLPYALPEKWNRKGLLTIFLALVFSIGIELAQYHFHLGRAETDDVICNTLGCVIGTLSYVISKKQKIFKEK